MSVTASKWNFYICFESYFIFTSLTTNKFKKVFMRIRTVKKCKSSMLEFTRRCDVDNYIICYLFISKYYKEMLVIIFAVIISIKQRFTLMSRPHSFLAVIHSECVSESKTKSIVTTYKLNWIIYHKNIYDIFNPISSTYDIRH